VPSVELTEDAEGDLDHITDYTIDRWGKVQARKYIRGLVVRMEQLAARPLIGRERKDLREGLRSFSFESHIIYYRPIEVGIRVLRVLHQSQEPHRHIREE